MSAFLPSGNSRGVSLRGLFDEAVFIGASDIQVGRCVSKADLCKAGDVFVPQQLASGDEHDRVEEAVRRGAAAVVSERLLPTAIPQCLVADTREAYGAICQALAGNPSQRMLTIGVVGSHGKTTTSLFISAMLKRMAGKVAYYTSLGSSDSNECDRTTTQPPGARRLAAWMQQADVSGSPAAVIELAPAMLKNRVTAGVEFDLLVLTGMRPSQIRGGQNLRRVRESLDAVSRQLKSRSMLLYNADDAYSAQWANNSGLPSVGYGIDASQHVRGKRLSHAGGEQQLLAIAGNTLMPLTLKMPGDHICRAALAAVATGWMFDFSVADAIAGVESLQCIPGHMQKIQQSVDIPLYIDEGDTPDRVAVALHALKQHQMGCVTAVVDVSSRLHPQWRQRLGEVLDKTGARVVLSAASCSSENAQSVIMDVLGGFRSPGRVEVIPNRDTAIRWAIKNTDTGCLLLSGCGTSPWLDGGELITTDEMVAKEAIDLKNHPIVAPKVSLFPQF